MSYCPIASAVGTRVLLDGGNAVDATVATALALAATYPQAGNLAGGGFMLIKPPDGDGHLLDYRESAPRLADPVLFAPANQGSVRGGLAVAVPGTVAGMAEALKRFGTWSWDRLVGPAIELAERGTWVTNRQAKYLSLYHKDLASFPETARAILPPQGMWRPGDLFRNPDLGKTLRLIGDNGPDAFSTGQSPTHRQDGAALRRRDGPWRSARLPCDLAQAVSSADLRSRHHDDTAAIGRRLRRHAEPGAARGRRRRRAAGPIDRSLRAVGPGVPHRLRAARRVRRRSAGGATGDARQV